MATPIPENAATFSLTEVAEATGGQVCAGRERDVIGVTTDSRGNVARKLFVALAGERYDGHEYVEQAAAAGAAAVLVERDVETLPPELGVVRVGSTLDALGALARLHRRRWAGTLVAVAGSAGKTTTRSAVAAALEAVLPTAVHSVAGNLNNRIGVPMVLFGLDSRHRAAVIEIGTNRPGEVEKIAHFAEPDIGVLTLIAIEHGEGLGGLDQIEREEGALFLALGPAATAITNADDERCIRQLAASSAGQKVRYGLAEGADYRLLRRGPLGVAGAELEIERPQSSRRSAPPGLIARQRLTLECPLLGEPGAYAALAAIAVCDRIAGEPVGGEALSEALAHAGEPGRLVPITLGDGSVVLDDTYNANPASMRSSLAAARELAEARSARLVLVLGEMRELGPISAEEHARVGEQVARVGAQCLVGVAGDARLYVERARAAGVRAEFSADAESAIGVVSASVNAGDVVLVKASRGVGLERIVEALQRERGSGALP
jgi:UDP-N-acetylmuramoyl-tripeptide--D-alanyl-D-alanine ligase